MDARKNVFFGDEDGEEPPHLDLSPQQIHTLENKYNFSSHQVKQFMESFSVFDRNADGLISSDELAQVMMALGHRPSLQEVEALIRGIDTDNDGCVSFDEFLRMMTTINENPEAELQEVFSVLDVDEDGVLSLSDLTHVLTNLGESISEEGIMAMMKEADLNHDGVINFKEFTTMLHAK